MSPTIIWAILGLVLIVAELVTFTFVLMFFGIAALVVSVCKVAGLDHLVFEIFLFSLIGLSGIFLFRKKMVATCSSRKNVAIDKYKPLILSCDVPAHGQARVTYQGTEWTAHNESGRDLKKGEKAIIARTEGIELFLNLPENLKEES